MSARGSARERAGKTVLSRAGQGLPASAASRFRLKVAAVLLALYVAVVLLVTLSPTPVDRPYSAVLVRLIRELHERGVPGWVGYPQIEFLSNVLLFVPLGFLAALDLPRRDWWLAAVAAPAFSALLELGQALFFPARTPSASDVVANGLGGAVGAVVSLLARMIVHHRDRLVAADVAGGHRSSDARP
ncbi:VanZ family protein [Naasia aerilata]|uniref:VanZ-like domain-containing protein n=1 Tax=Naasia aerilata TaxID=1162966 RepID=A0ABM8GCI2_9MICO|nr:VanZ family protein [Naasia aerilata]BDZ45953.1 hypothetical protein GCM10025866_18620 [Naasia aerilata]